MFAQVSDIESLSAILKIVHEAGVEALILGAGTNLLISDLGYDGVVVKLRDDSMEFESSNAVVRAGAGASTHGLVQACVDRGLGGLEFAAGLPGSVGGAIAGNAGCFGHCLSDRLLAARVVHPDGTVERVASRDWFAFSYRSSRLQDSGVALASVEFSLEPKDRQLLIREAREKVALRRDKHPGAPIKTAGSYFKNLPAVSPGERRRPAGALLDAVGCKELRCGGAAVFHKHANIVVNRGHATAVDVLALTGEMSRRVAERFGLELQPEVRFVGPRPELGEIQKRPISSKKKHNLLIDLANGSDGK